MPTCRQPPPGGRRPSPPSMCPQPSVSVPSAHASPRSTPGPQRHKGNLALKAHARFKHMLEVNGAHLLLHPRTCSSTCTSTRLLVRPRTAARIAGIDSPMRRIGQGLYIVGVLGEGREALFVRHVPKLDGRVGTARHERRLVRCHRHPSPSHAQTCQPALHGQQARAVASFVSAVTRPPAACLLARTGRASSPHSMRNHSNRQHTAARHLAARPCPSVAPEPAPNPASCDFPFNLCRICAGGTVVSRSQRTLCLHSLASRKSDRSSALLPSQATYYNRDREGRSR